MSTTFGMKALLLAAFEIAAQCDLCVGGSGARATIRAFGTGGALAAAFVAVDAGGGGAIRTVLQFVSGLSV